MQRLYKLLEKNRKWAKAKTAENSEFFTELAKGQQPKYLWIGCADSRVAVSNLLDLEPGVIFVHRNIANVVTEKDLNCLSVMEYAIDSLKIEHVIICGHYGCGGVKVALDMYERSECCQKYDCECEEVDTRDNSLVTNWLHYITEVKDKYKEVLRSIDSKEERFAKLCELNVFEQLKNCCKTSVIQNAWARGQHVAVHAFIYDLETGLLKDFQVEITNNKQLEEISDIDAVLNKIAEFEDYGKN
ncbi:carbonic anhydrase [Lentisphaerota bacterium WC36G]|nr:carbonic anhydrase [Lentisphaerae bacterium WC36]